MSNINNQSVRLMRMKDLQKYVGISRAHLFNMVKDGRFPAGKSISPSVVVWDKRVIDSWIDEHIGVVA